MCLVAAGVPAQAAPFAFDGRRGGEIVAAGAFRLVVVSGSSRGPDASTARRLSGADLGLDGDDGEPYTARSRVIRSGDVNGDGYDDLVVAVESRERPVDSAIAVVPGSARGLRTDRAYHVRSGEGWPELGQTALLVADLDGDGFDDVSSSYWHEEPGLIDGVTASRGRYRVVVFWGSARGVRDWRATSVALPPEHNGWLLLGVGDVVGDRRRDLVVVDSGYERDDDADLPEEPGGVMVCEVAASRGVACGDQVELPGGLTDVAVGDFVGGRRDDVVVGLPYDGSSEDEQYGGALYELRATPRGLAPARMITQDSPGVPGRDRDGDEFGYALAAADLDGDGKTDLAVGAPYKGVGGRVTVLYGDRAGLGYARDRVITLNTRGVPGRSEPGDAFGRELSLLDVDGDGRADLVAAAPWKKKGAVLAVATSPRSGRPAPRRWATLLRARDVGIGGLDPAFGYRVGR